MFLTLYLIYFQLSLNCFFNPYQNFSPIPFPSSRDLSFTVKTFKLKPITYNPFSLLISLLPHLPKYLRSDLPVLTFVPYPLSQFSLLNTLYLLLSTSTPTSPYPHNSHSPKQSLFLLLPSLLSLRNNLCFSFLI